MSMKTKFLAAGAAIAMATSSVAADAALIEGTGFWLTGTPVTTYSAPNNSFQFSFNIPDAFSGSVTSAITNFVYTLNGVTVATAADAIEFYQLADGGLFDIDFGSTRLSLYGVDIGFDGSVGPEGGYQFTSEIDGNGLPLEPTGFGFVTVSELGGAVVPEPATWALMIAGMGLVGGALRRRRIREGEVTFA